MDDYEDRAEESEDEPDGPRDTEEVDVIGEALAKAVNPAKPKLEENAVKVHSFEEVCGILNENTLTLKRRIVYHQVPVELHDQDFGHTLYGTLEEWPREEASCAVMIRKSDLDALVSTHGETLSLPGKSPGKEDEAPVPSSEEPRRGRGRDKFYPATRKICMKILKEDHKRGKGFKSAEKLHEEVVKKLKANAPSERSISRWMGEWIEEIKKGE